MMAYRCDHCGQDVADDQHVSLRLGGPLLGHRPLRHRALDFHLACWVEHYAEAIDAALPPVPEPES